MNTAQQDLLQATLLEPPQALEAYQCWKAQIDFERLPSSSFAILPKLYKNLEAHLNDELTPRLKGIYKQAWVRQQQRILQQQCLLEVLEKNALEFRWLDDATLDVLASVDVYIQAEPVALFQFLRANNFLIPEKQHQFYPWNSQGWLTLKGGIRVFAKAIPEIWLHRLAYTSNELLWLVQTYPNLQNVRDFTAWFETAKPLGLQKHLYTRLELAQQAQLLDITLPLTTFSSFDEMQFQRNKHPIRLMRGYYAMRLAWRQGQAQGLFEYLQHFWRSA